MTSTWVRRTRLLFIKQAQAECQHRFKSVERSLTLNGASLKEAHQCTGLLNESFKAPVCKSSWAAKKQEPLMNGMDTFRQTKAFFKG